MIHTLNMVWNPSEGIDLGFFLLRFYSLSWVLAFGLGWYIMKPIFIRENESVESLDKLFVYTLVATMLGARLGHVIFYQSELFHEDPLSILLPISTQPTLHFTGFAGLASHGAAIGIIITMFYIQKRVIKRSFLWILDRIVIPVSLGAIFIRLGNFFNSEIVGTETNSSFGIKFLRDQYSPNEAIQITQIGDKNEAYNTIANNPQFTEYLSAVTPKHPAQLYEAIGYIILFFLLRYLYNNKVNRPNGYLFGMFFVVLFSVRFLVEFVKVSQGGFETYIPLLSTGQWLSIPMILFGLFFMFKKSNSK
mgnify:CR=1 FL=1